MNLIVVAVLLLLLVGPCFGPIPAYLVSKLTLRPATGWLMVAIFIALGLVLIGMRSRMKPQGQQLADLGWAQPSSWPVIFLGTGLGLLWGVFGVIGFLHFNPEANPFEISLFRLFTAIAGAIIAAGEDMVTRGYVMHELQRLNAPNWLQIVASSLLFALYHSIWNFNLPGFVVSLIYGLILGGIFILGKRSLTPVILAHSLALLLGEPFFTMSLLTAIQRGG